MDLASSGSAEQTRTFVDRGSRGHHIVDEEQALIGDASSAAAGESIFSPGRLAPLHTFEAGLIVTLDDPAQEPMNQGDARAFEHWAGEGHCLIEPPTPQLVGVQRYWRRQVDLGERWSRCAPELGQRLDPLGARAVLHRPNSIRQRSSVDIGGLGGVERGRFGATAMAEVIQTSAGEGDPAARAARGADPLDRGRAALAEDSRVEPTAAAGAAGREEEVEPAFEQ